MLRIEKLTAGYGDVTILREVSLEVNEGEIVALIGANGAGKTTTINAISGLVDTRGGSILFEGNSVDGWPSHRIVKAGLVQVAEGRKLFPRLSVLENLEMGSFIREAKRHRSQSLEMVFDLFPRLAERSSQKAGTLSGGEQQMLAVARALMTRPRLLMLDEPSLGLAPLLVNDIFQAVQEINKEGTTVLIVEQNAVKALEMCNRGYVLESGKIVLEGTGSELLGDERIRSAYLGL